MFWYQDEMTVETKHDQWDRLTYGRVVEDTFEAVTCPASRVSDYECDEQLTSVFQRNLRFNG